MATFPEDEQKELQATFVQGGVKALSEKVYSTLNKWKSQPLNVAVIGNSGVGKSSFINAVRNLRPGQPGAAPVGVTETTFEIKEYPHPEHKNLVFWDLPGVGTPNFPKDSYVKQIGIDQFDFFLLLSSERFTENDAFLADAIQRESKHVYFVRTKIDITMSNEKYDHPEGFEETSVLEKIRHNILENLQVCGLKNPTDVYLISSRCVQAWDFPILLRNLLKDFPALKKDALVLSMTAMTEDLIKEKKQTLKARIKRLAVLSAVGGSVPIPGFAAAVDISILVTESNFYQQQFGLDDESLSHAGISDEVKKNVLVETGKVPLTAAFILTQLAATGVAEELFALSIPIIGSIVGGSLSYMSTTKFLTDCLDRYTLDALALNKYIIEHAI